MAKKCSHLVEKGHANQRDHYTCDITERLCVAGTYEDSPSCPGGSCEFAEYHPYLAKLCPGYKVPDRLAEKVRKYWKKK